jgi:OOP family OmpA-OmpF porin
MAVALWLPLWTYADSEPGGDESQPAITTDVMQEKMPAPVPMAETQAEQASTEMSAVTAPPLPRINSLGSSSGTMEFIPLNHVFFDHDKALLNQRSKSILDDAAQYVLLSNNIERIIIHGHANSIAGKDYNDRLSDKRANAVKNYLIKKQVPAELMSVTGWGESDPIDENWTRVGSQRNRRVEIYLVQQTAAK